MPPSHSSRSQFTIRRRDAVRLLAGSHSAMRTPAHGIADPKMAADKYATTTTPTAQARGHCRRSPTWPGIAERRARIDFGRLAFGPLTPQRRRAPLTELPRPTWTAGQL